MVHVPKETAVHVPKETAVHVPKEMVVRVFEKMAVHVPKERVVHALNGTSDIESFVGTVVRVGARRDGKPLLSPEAVAHVETLANTTSDSGVGGATVRIYRLTPVRRLTLGSDSRIPIYSRPGRTNAVQPLWAVLLPKTCRTTAVGRCPAKDMG